MDNKTLMHHARAVAEVWSDNVAGRKTSVLFVDGTGRIILWDANRFPPHVKRLEERVHGDKRYNFIEHAERNAAYKATHRGINLEGTTAVLPWFPCVDCARCLALVGITKMICIEPDWTDARYSFNDAKAILEESGVVIEYYKES